MNNFSIIIALLLLLLSGCSTTGILKSQFDNRVLIYPKGQKIEDTPAPDGFTITPLDALKKSLIIHKFGVDIYADSQNYYLRPRGIAQIVPDKSYKTESSKTVIIDGTTGSMVTTPANRKW